MSVHPELPTINQQPSLPEITAEPSRLNEMMHNGRRHLGRAALILSMATGPAIALNTGEAVFAPQRAEAATEFVNDYPDMDATDCSAIYGIYSWCKGNPSGWLSSRGYGYRNCVDGASYWVNKYTSVDPRGWGNANTWDNNATAYTVKSGNTNSIEPGDIAQSDDGSFGHVAFVTSVTKNADGTVASFRTAELNKAGNGEYSDPSANLYNTRNASGKFIRSGSNDWDHYIDVNGAGKGLNNENLNGGGGGGGVNDKINELGFVRTNHGSGQTELVSWHGAPNYATLRASSLTGYPAISDPNNVTPLAIDTNGDGIDELGFVRTNHSSGQTELSVWDGSPHYTTHLTTALTGYPAISDPENVTPIAIDVNGDGIDELGFVRSNHSSGKTELSVWHGSPNYTTHLATTLTGYPAISDPENVTPLAIDTNGDGIDELGFVRSNHSSGRSELSVWHGSPNYTTHLATSLTGYPAISDPANVTPLAIDVNGDKIDELSFARTNHGSGRTELVTWHGSPGYTTLHSSVLTGYPSIADPQNVTVLPIHLPNS